MARRSFTPEQLQEFQSFAAQWGKIIARRAFGDDGPGLDVGDEKGTRLVFMRSLDRPRKKPQEA